jgi:predicted O-methyltransferase YrrM
MTMPAELRARAEAARGFMPVDEGLALYEAAASVTVPGPFLEIGSYCGKSAVYLGTAARERATVLVALDHHRGSEENQPGWEYHDASLVDPHAGRLDTLPALRRTLFDAGVEDVVIPVVGDSGRVAAVWSTPAGLVFIDGGHTEAAAQRDYACWAPRVLPGGLLAIHDVFPDPADGGRPPYHIYLKALGSGEFTQVRATGSLRVLRRVA